MVVGTFPLFKLGVLLIRQISKPIAGYIKEGAKRSVIFRNYICLPTAQIYHWSETRWKLFVMGFGKPMKVTPLKEEVAIEVGADILSEVFIFGTAAGLLTVEYVRQSNKAARKEEAERQRIVTLESKVIELDLAHEQLRAQLRELERNMHSSPLRALKEKLIPSSAEAKNNQKSAASASLAPGTRIVTVERTDALSSNGHSIGHVNDTSQFLPVPQWDRPFTGSNSATPANQSTPTSNATTDSLKATGVGAASVTDPPKSSTGTLNASSSSADAVSHIRSTTEAKHDHAYRTKMVRRAMKILMDAYEDYDDD